MSAMSYINIWYCQPLLHAHHKTFSFTRVLFRSAAKWLEIVQAEPLSVSQGLLNYLPRVEHALIG